MSHHDPVVTELPDGPQPLDDPDLDYDGSLSADLSIAARALALGAALHAPDAVDGLGNDLGRLGFSDLPPAVDDGSYETLLSASDEYLEQYQLTQTTRRHEGRPTARVQGNSHSLRPQGGAIWSEAAQGDPVAAVSWLRAINATNSGLRQVAAAAALQPKPDGATPNGPRRGGQTTRIERSTTSVLTGFATNAPAQARAGQSTSSRAQIASNIASAALAGEPDANEPETLDRRPAHQPTRHPVSTIVHGTNAYLGEWWTPGGDFHTFVKTTISTDLYDDGQYFQWSGKYSGEHREIAAQRLLDWSTPYGGHLRRIFAHSYGGIIALRAIGLGLRVDELILLSTPVEEVDTDWDRVGRVHSLRIHMDLILMAARRRQVFDLPVAEYHLPKWFVGHGDSHEPNMWEQHDIARAMGLA